jgi:hypothetical protein
MQSSRIINVKFQWTGWIVQAYKGKMEESAAVDGDEDEWMKLDGEWEQHSGTSSLHLVATMSLQCSSSSSAQLVNFRWW